MTRRQQSTCGMALALIASAGCTPDAPTASGAPKSVAVVGARATFLDVTYAPKSNQEKLDLYLPPPATALAPLVIWIHGGAFTVGDKSYITFDDSGPAPQPTSHLGPYQVQHPDVSALLAKGYAVASLNYRLEGHANVFVAGGRGCGGCAGSALDAGRDAKAAVRFLRANASQYGLDPDRFAVWGNSAGGYMVTVLGVTGDQSTTFDDPSLGNMMVSSAVQAVIDWYGVMLMGEASPMTYIATAHTLPPFFIEHGSADQSVNVSVSSTLQAALVQRGAQSTLTIIPGAGHEDHAFSATQLPACYAFIDQALGR